MQEELTKVEDEINTLKQVLASKETQASELRKKLGIGFGQQIQQKFATIADSDTVKRELAYTRAVLDEIKNNPRVKRHQKHSLKLVTLLVKLSLDLVLLQPLN